MDEWGQLQRDWLVTLRAERFSGKTVAVYEAGLASLRRWLDVNRPDLAPADLSRRDVRGWLADLQDHSAGSTPRTYYAAVRSFCRWLVAEGEAKEDATEGTRTPPSPEPVTPVVDAAGVRRMLALCAGSSFRDRRDNGLIRVAFDSGTRLAELAGLTVDDVDADTGLLTVRGKGSARHGARTRGVQVGARTQRALLSYLRARARQPRAQQTDRLWLTTTGRNAALSAEMIRKMFVAYGRRAGIPGFHIHMARHTWAHRFQADDGSWADLMALGGWRNPAVAQRYGASLASSRAADAYRRRGTFGDSL